MTSSARLHKIPVYYDGLNQVIPMRTDLFFARHPVFTRTEFAAACMAAGPSGERTPDALLAYHTKERRLLRVRRGLYAVVPKGADPATVPLDAFLLAARMTDDAVVAYHSALELHGGRLR